MLYNILWISAVQQCESAISIYIPLPLDAPPPTLTPSLMNKNAKSLTKYCCLLWFSRYVRLFAILANRIQPHIKRTIHVIKLSLSQGCKDSSTYTNLSFNCQHFCVSVHLLYSWTLTRKVPYFCFL